MIYQASYFVVVIFVFLLVCTLINYNVRLDTLAGLTADTSRFSILLITFRFIIQEAYQLSHTDEFSIRGRKFIMV